MTILDRSKIRKDVLKVMDKSSRIQMKGAFGFLNLEENKGRNLQDYLGKIAKGNKEFFERLARNDGTAEELFDLLSYDEQVFMAKLFRLLLIFMQILKLKNIRSQKKLRLK